MNGRKREEEREKREDESKGKTRRRRVSPPDTSTLSSLLTLLNSISPTNLKTLICTSFNSTLYTIYSNTTIFSFRLSSSSSTECTLEAEHVIPFSFTFSFTFGTTEIICPM